MTPRLSRSALLLALAALAAVAMLSACGGDDDGGSDPSGTEPVAEGSIDQDNLAFKPEKITIKVGGNVTFTNSETAIHTVTIDAKNISGTMKKGDTVVWTAPKAGTFKVTCDFHPQMKATITAQ